MLKAIIFDFDGTLVDTMGSIWAEYQRTMDRMGLRRITHRDFTKEVGREWDKIINKFWPGLDPRDFTRHYHVEAEEVKPFPGGQEALMRLSEDYTLALMTSRGRKTLYSHLEKAGLDAKLFKIIHHRNSLRHNKPDPRALLQVCEELEVKPSEAVYVGDSIIDAECALKAGTGFIAVRTGGAYDEDFLQMGVTVILDSVAKLPEKVNAINQRTG